jgi:hypothetical protein
VALKNRGSAHTPAPDLEALDASPTVEAVEQHVVVAPAPAAAPAPAVVKPAPAGGGKIDALYAHLGDAGAQIRGDAEQAYADFRSTLPKLKLTPAEEDDVKWATHALAVAGFKSIGAKPDDVAKLQRQRQDAISVLADINAVKVNDGQKLVTQLVLRIFTKAQDVLLGIVTKAAIAAVA